MSDSSSFESWSDDDSLDLVESFGRLGLQPSAGRCQRTYAMCNISHLETADLAHQYAFRVWSNQSGSPFDQEKGFLAYHQDWVDTISKPNTGTPQLAGSALLDVQTHVKVWCSKTGFVSASLSFLWAIYDCERRATQKGRYAEPDVEIAFITLAALDSPDSRSESIILPLNYLNGNATAWNFAAASRELLVVGSIPAEAIVISIPWVEIKVALPLRLRRELQSCFDSPRATFPHFAATVRCSGDKLGLDADVVERIMTLSKKKLRPLFRGCAIPDEDNLRQSILNGPAVQKL